jgi:hypothetical protein
MPCVIAPNSYLCFKCLLVSLLEWIICIWHFTIFESEKDRRIRQVICQSSPEVTQCIRWAHYVIFDWFCLCSLWHFKRERRQTDGPSGTPLSSHFVPVDRRIARQHENLSILIWFVIRVTDLEGNATAIASMRCCSWLFVLYSRLIPFNLGRVLRNWNRSAKNHSAAATNFRIFRLRSGLKSLGRVASVDI